MCTPPFTRRTVRADSLAPSLKNLEGKSGKGLARGLIGWEDCPAVLSQTQSGTPISFHSAEGDLIHSFKALLDSEQLAVIDRLAHLKTTLLELSAKETLFPSTSLPLVTAADIK